MIQRLRLTLAALLLVYSAISMVVGSAASGDLSLNLAYCRWLPCSRDLPELARSALWEDTDIDDALVLAGFREALARDPASPFRWCDLGEAYMQQGRMSEARDCFEQAVKRGPFSPRILMRAANFYFVAGDTSTALSLSARCLAGVRDYDATVFRQYERLGIPLGELLEIGLPPHEDATRSWFLFLMRPDAASDDNKIMGTSWRHLVDRGFAGNDLLGRYVSWLVARKHFEQAVAVQEEFYAPGVESVGSRRTNLLFNPGFERTPSGSPLDWRIRSLEGVEVTRVPQDDSEGSTALRIEFSKAGNPHYRHVSQQAVVLRGRLRFSAAVRSDGITSDQGIGFQIVDAEAPHRFDVSTESVRGTTNWTTVETEFEPPPDTKLLEVRVVRRPSLKFDNQLSGTVWIDDVSLGPARHYSADTGPPPSVR